MVCMKMVPECVPMYIVGLDWYNGRHGYVHALCPSLAICYDNGLIQLMCNESDSGILRGLAIWVSFCSCCMYSYLQIIFVKLFALYMQVGTAFFINMYIMHL